MTGEPGRGPELAAGGAVRAVASGAAAVLTRHTVASPDGLRLSVLVAAPLPGAEIALSPGAALAEGLPSGTAVGLQPGMAVGEGFGTAAAVPSSSSAAGGLPPVLAVHGYASSAAGGWGRTGHLDALARAGRVVIALDLRGHGKSDKPHDAGAYSLSAVLTDLVTVVAHIPALLEQAMAGESAPDAPAGAAADAPEAAAGKDAPGAAVDVIGYSLGSRLTWTAACRGLFPIRRMVLGGFDGRPLFQGVDPARLDRLAAGSAGSDRIALRNLVAGLTGTGGRPDELPPPAIATLVVAGDQDPLASGAQDFAAGLPQGEFLVVPGRDHISAVPARVYRERMVGFLAEW